MRFRNTKSGAIVEVSSMLRGNWERIDGDTPAKAETVAVSIPETKDEETPVKSAKKTRARRSSKK